MRGLGAKEVRAWQLGFTQSTGLRRRAAVSRLAQIGAARSPGQARSADCHFEGRLSGLGASPC